MVKRKTRNVPVPDAPITGPSCVHVRKALDEGTVKKALVNVDWTICQDCVMDVKEKDGTDEEPVERPAVWLCLQCGHRGCGRYSEHQHALNHYNTPRSVPHSLVLSTETWSVWCYACDAEVPFASMGRLGQLVGYIQKKSKPPNKAVLVEQEACASEKEEKPKSKAGESKEEQPHQAVKVEKTANATSNNQEPTVKGLSNLGNTCFFNAVMQNLSQTPTLKELVNEVKLPQSVTVSLPDSNHQEVHLDQPPGPLTLAMCQFLMEMQETKKGVVTPKEVFSQVCKKAARFKGYQQQDSQELLRYLLDGMRGEEIQRISAATAEALHGTPGNLDEEEIKKKVKDCEKRRGFPNFVDRLFGGELTSTIMCEECHTVSLVHEPFLDLSLPVLDDVLTKKVSQKMLKNVGLKKAENDDDDDEEEEEPHNSRYIKDNDEGSGTSKHLQKKAKKQAKKQAKSQRRQQKIQDNTVLLNNLCASENGDGGENEEPHSSNPLESGTNSNLGSSASLDGMDTAAPEGNAAPNIMDLESDPKFVLEKPSEDIIKPADAELECSTEVCKEILGERDAGCLEKSSETSAEDLEICNGTSVGNLENSMDVSGENQDNGTGVCVGNTEYGTEVALGNLENGTAGCPDVANSELLADTKPHTEPVQEDDQLTEDLNRLNLGPIIEPSEIQLEIMDEPPASQVYEVVNEDPKTAFSTLSDRDGVQLEEHSVLSCLYQFTHKESLTGNNQLLCNVCTRKHASKPKNNAKADKKRVFTNAKKQMLISAPPPILTLHLKRFQQNGFNLHKINKHIKFPELIDLAPFCTLKCKNIRERESGLLYSLYGVIEHSGTMRSGHYTAFIKLRSPTPQFCNLVLQGRMAEESRADPPRGHWYHVSDSHVQPVPLSKVLSSQDVFSSVSECLRYWARTCCFMNGQAGGPRTLDTERTECVLARQRLCNKLYAIYVLQLQYGFVKITVGFIFYIPQIHPSASPKIQQ
uniref:Ubiquitin carboxyl-terminal hydrolase n=1 Tax=Leptobrachium leishanense TaxID=445787 RepID=A0A8C5MCQ8_9ANUR